MRAAGGAGIDAARGGAATSRADIGGADIGGAATAGSALCRRSRASCFGSGWARFTWAGPGRGAASFCGDGTRGAGFCSADLWSAGFRGAGFGGAGFCCAGPCAAGLCGAGLCGADVCGACLCCCAPLSFAGRPPGPGFSIPGRISPRGGLVSFLWAASGFGAGGSGGRLPGCGPEAGVASRSARTARAASVAARRRSARAAMGAVSPGSCLCACSAPRCSIHLAQVREGAASWCS